MNHRSKSLSLLLCFVLVASLLGVAFARPVAASRTAAIQPQLQQAAAAYPDSLVRVIARKADATGAAAARAVELGGKIFYDLDMIDALAVEMPAAAALELARSESVSWVALDGPVRSSNTKPASYTGPTANTYLDTLGVRDAWTMGYRGQGITVAVIDSGLEHTDFSGRVLFSGGFNADLNKNDSTGHGTHVTGIIAGNGAGSSGAYMGIAPQANLIALNVSNNAGMAYESDVVAAMQWIYNNKAAYNIRILNLSINSAVAASYHDSPMNAAAEILWFNGVVVITAAGNSGNNNSIDTIKAAPANDPFFITVGATNEKQTVDRADDVITTYSAAGWTLDNHSKPEIYAPGQDIISTLPNNSTWKNLYPERTITIDGRGTIKYRYFRASGTSMSAPMVSGAAALLLQKEPGLTPDQVKYRLITASGTIQGKPYLDVKKALTTATTASSNTGLMASRLLSTGSEPIVWGSVAWNSVAWNSVAWNSVAWNSVAWNSVAWNSVTFSSTFEKDSGFRNQVAWNK